MLATLAEKLMALARPIGILVVALATGCAGLEEAPPGVPAQSARLVAVPPLDVTALRARLQDSNAIGVLTKLALKNQVDDLLGMFRAYYQSGRKANVASLRQSYDMLVLKLLALVQDVDPPLARTVLASREAIWGSLVDPEKLHSVT